MIRIAPTNELRACALTCCWQGTSVLGELLEIEFSIQIGSSRTTPLFRNPK